MLSQTATRTLPSDTLYRIYRKLFADPSRGTQYNI